MSTRPAPSASGNFAKTPFAHVVLHIRERGLTGTLAVQLTDTDLAGESLLAFERGAIAQVRLPQVVDPLGVILHELNVIDAHQLEESLLRMAAGQGLQGEILLAMGACTPDVIKRGLAEQNRRKLRIFFDVPDAAYQYYDGLDLLKGYGSSRVLVDVLATLWRGIRANPDRPAIEQVLSRVGAQHLKLKSDHADLRRFGFGVEEEAVLDILRFDTSSLVGLLDSKQDPRLVRALAYTLVITKMVDLVPARSVARAPVIGVPPRAASPEPPAAPSAPAKPAEPEPEEPSGPKRDGRDELAAPMRKKLEDAEAAFEAMQEQTYYQMLEITDKATTNDVKSAFMTQAAKWHPDRVGPSAPLVLEAYKKVFALLNEAQNTLTDFEQRKRYDDNVKEGAGTPASQKRMIAMLEAATDVQKAEIHVKRREYAEAEKLLKRALKAMPDDPTALTVYGTLLLDSRGENGHTEAEPHLTKAVELSPENDRALVALGTIVKRKGNIAGALELFQRAQKANPKNMDAAREVRLAEMRQRNRGPASGESNAPSGAPSAVSGLASRLTSGLSSLSKLVKKS